MHLGTYSKFQENYALNGNSYQDVYINEIDIYDDYEIYFNSTVGIFRFTSEDGEIDLTFDRVEFD
ncbi:MAG: hypothetical protein ACI8YQ_004555 [Polaribacter sp.]|jgi:hypothetical protein